MKFSSLFACFSSVSLISGASIPTDKSGTCSSISSVNIDLGDEDSIDEKKLQQLDSHYQQNVDCIDAAYDQQKQTLTGTSYVIAHASSADYVTAIKALANYMRAIDAADTKGTLNQTFVNASMVYFDTLPESFKISEKTKRDLQEEQDPKSSSEKHRFMDWVKKTNFSLRSKIGKLDHAQRSSLNSDSRFVLKNYKRILTLIKTGFKNSENGMPVDRSQPFFERLGYELYDVQNFFENTIRIVFLCIVCPPLPISVILYFLANAFGWVADKILNTPLPFQD